MYSYGTNSLPLLSNASYVYFLSSSSPDVVYIYIVESWYIRKLQESKMFTLWQCCSFAKMDHATGRCPERMNKWLADADYTEKNIEMIEIHGLLDHMSHF